MVPIYLLLKLHFLLDKGYLNSGGLKDLNHGIDAQNMNKIKLKKSTDIL